MTLASATAWLARHAPDLRVTANGRSTATVAEAALALDVAPARVAKTLALRVGDAAMLVVAAGDARLDNAKVKAAFGGRPRMVDAPAALALTGHPVGGVCPFGLATPLPVWCDATLRGHASVFPAAGSRDASVEIDPDRLAALVARGWVDVCRRADA
jgi:prolyl-tRNA editing enzyme YbaK/EbsC (Cys-tRNA(Pro) deacylase)